MKKFLLIILIGFILSSVLTLSFTIQAINSFNEFNDDDENDDDEQDSAGVNSYQESEIIMVWNEIYDANYVDVAYSFKISFIIQEYS